MMATSTTQSGKSKVLTLTSWIASVVTKTWALGSFNTSTIEKKNSKGRHICMEWLDKQELISVIYVSFGTTSFKEEQIKEIATGLEQSKQKFI